jgi:O-antigen ligase
MRRKIVAFCDTSIKYSFYGIAGTMFFAWSAMQLFFAFTLLAFLLKLILTFKAEYKQVRVNMFDWAFFAIFILSFISCFFGVNPMKSLGQYAFLKTAGWMFMYLAARIELQNSRQLKTVVWILIGSAFTGAFYGILKGIIYNEPRMGGGLGHPIHFGMGMNFALAILLAVILYKTEKFRKSIKQSISEWTILLVASVFCVFAMVGSRASSALVALAAFICVMALVCRKKAAFILVAVLLAVFAAGVILLPQSKFGAAIIKITDKNNLSVAERLLMWKSGALIIKDHPMGVGIDNLSLVYMQYYQTGAREGNQGHLHNNFIQLTAERGIITLFAYLFFIAAFYIVTLRALPDLKTIFEKYIVIGVIGVFTIFWVTGIFEYTWGASHGILNFWFITGLGMAIIAGSGKNNPSNRRKTRNSRQKISR